MFAGIILLQAWGPSLFGAEPQVALLVSQHTRDYFTSVYQPRVCLKDDWTLGTHEYERYYKGWERILKQSSIDYSIIEDADINSAYLQNIKLLILVNNFWLDRSQTKLIAEWVRQGGRLLATFGSGYSGVEGDFLKGGTNGLHELWGDPSAKANSSFYYGNPWVQVQISQNGGPTFGLNAGQVLDYEYMANVLIQRPYSSRDINAFFVFNDNTTSRPAIFNNRHGKGQVVYYAFAPEYLISLDSDDAGHCSNDTRYSDAAWRSKIKDIADHLAVLMAKTLDHLK